MMDFTSFSSNQADLLEFDQSDLTLSDKLKVFKAPAFDPESYLTGRCRHMSEKVKFLFVSHLLDEEFHLFKGFFPLSFLKDPNFETFIYLV